MSWCPVACFLSLSKERVCAMKHIRNLCCMLIVVFCFCGNKALAQNDSGPYAYALDQKMKSVQKISLSSEKVLASYKMKMEPSYMMQSPDKTKLLVFDACKKEGGLGHRKNDPRYFRSNIYRCKNPNSVTILDAGNLEMLAEIQDVGLNAIAHAVMPAASLQRDLGVEVDSFWDASGKKLTILAWGKEGKTAELVQLDVEKGQVNGRLSLKSEPWLVGGFTKLTDDIAALYSAWRWTDRQKKAYEHTLLFVNLQILEQSKELTLAGRPQFLYVSPNGQFAYELADNGEQALKAGRLT